MTWLRPSLASTRELCFGFLALAMLFGCSGGSDDDTPDQPTGAGGDGSSTDNDGRQSMAIGGASSETAEPAFDVVVTTTGNRISTCPGACVQLMASADNGVPPYTFTFDHDLGSGAGPHTVCPTETTRYQVTVHDSSVDDDEFNEKHGDVTQSIAIEVDSTCGDDDDAGAAADGGPLTVSGPPGAVLCKPRIAAEHTAGDLDTTIDIWWDDFSPKLAVDADDASVLAITFQGTLDLADGTSVTSSGAYNVLVAKFSADCKPLWFRTIQGDLGANEPMLAVDSKRNVIVTTRSTVPDIMNSISHSQLLLSAFDTNGDALWSKSFDSAPGLHWQGALRVDANDDIVWLTSAASRTDFGGGMLGVGTSLDPTMEVLAKFDSAGNHIWSEMLQESTDGNGQENGTNASLAIVNGTDIVFHGWSIDTRDWGAAGQTQAAQAGQPHSYLVHANAAGDYVKSEVTGEGDGARYGLTWIEAGSAGKLVLANIGTTGLAVRSSAGDVAWSKQPIDPAHGFPNDVNKLVVDADDNIIVGGTFRTSTTVNDVALTAANDTNQDAFVQKLNADGDVLWTYQTKDELLRDEALLGVDSDSAGNVAALVVGYADGDEALYLVKLVR